MCRLKEYGNCDPETRGQDYCVFHKPGKNEDEAREFYRKLLERFKHRVEMVYDKGEGRVIRRFVFEDELDCRGFVFPEIPGDVDFSFRHAVFKKKACFHSAVFESDVDFTGAVFEGDACFSEATFMGHVDFGGEEEGEYCRFYGLLRFANAEFRKGVSIDLPSECFRLPEAEAEACRVQALSYERELDRSKADEMFVRERRARRRAVVWRAREEFYRSKGLKSKLKAAWSLVKAYASSTIEFLLADMTCRYGTDWKRPIALWVIAVLFLFPLAYWITGGVRVHSFFDYLYFSIVTATTLGYGDLHPVGVGKMIASIEAVYGTFMWAVFLAVFAMKYMR